jgi:hypothetical protein
MKDPAFLFYSKDFYEGTRTMLPTERACYIDLMIYQHQHGFIPDDLERVSMYCNGCSQETVKTVLEAKFKLCLDGWYNETMKRVIDERNVFSNKQSINGTVGQFWKKAKSILNKKEYAQLRDLMNYKTNQEIYNLVNELEINEAMLKAMLITLHKHLEDANANEDEDVNEEEITSEEEEEEEKEKKEQEPKTEFEKFNAWLKDSCPNVSRLRTQITEEQMMELIEKYGKQKFIDILMQMENKYDLNKKYVSVYLTARNWLKNDFNKQPNEQRPKYYDAIN